MKFERSIPIYIMFCFVFLLLFETVSNVVWFQPTLNVRPFKNRVSNYSIQPLSVPSQTNICQKKDFPKKILTLIRF